LKNGLMLKPKSATCNLYEQVAPKKLNDLPFVSVIVPVYNDENGIQLTLRSLEKQNYPTDQWEVIVIDNNSTDQSKVKAFLFQDKISTLKVVSEARRSSYAARNKGIELAKGDILAFIDSDMTVGTDWITKGVGDIKNQDADYVGCRVDIYLKFNPPTVWEIFNQRTGFPIKEYMEKGGFAGAGNLFVRKEVIQRLGAFDARLISSGDLEFGNRVKDGGFKMYYSDHNIMHHPARSSMSSLLKKTIRLARGFVDLRYLFPERYGSLKLEPILRSFRPRLLPHKSFQNLGTVTRLQVTMIQYLLYYTRIIGEFVRYVQIKLNRK
jgi:glycosyltransferase AglI